jgi:hypothetical protein
LDDDGTPLVDPQTRLPRDAEARRILFQEREGALMWPERFGPAELQRIKAGLGPYMASGRLQQSPQPKQGGIFRRDWWQPWNDDKFPVLSYIIGSVDGAFSEKEENDPSAMTVWGCFQLCKTCGKSINDFPAEGVAMDNLCDCGRRVAVNRIILVNAWRKHLPMHSDPQPRLKSETPVAGDTPQTVRFKNAQWYQRVGDSLGLVERVAYTCRQWGVQKLLIENKASGKTAAQELQRLYSYDDMSVQLWEPKGDKVSRALSVQPLFANGIIHAP